MNKRVKNGICDRSGNYDPGSLTNRPKTPIKTTNVAMPMPSARSANPPTSSEREIRLARQRADEIDDEDIEDTPT